MYMRSHSFISVLGVQVYCVWVMSEQEYTITSIKDFFDWIDESRTSTVSGFNEEKADFEHAKIYYRGQSCRCWPVKASIFREPFDNDPLCENHILKVAEQRLWGDLSRFSSFLEKLVYLQHYGMPTRLVDVTFNPLVALYYACSEREDCDGVVFCGFQHDITNDKIANLTAEYIFSHSHHNTPMDR